jgi:hypothetical protein
MLSRSCKGLQTVDQKTKTLSAAHMSRASCGMVPRVAQSSRIHASAAEHDVGVSGDAFYHPLQVVIAVRRFLSELSGKHGIGHQKHRDVRFFRILLKRKGKPHGVEAVFSPIRRIVYDEQDIHAGPQQYNSIQLNN